jgi:hypothetical protein
MRPSRLAPLILAASIAVSAFGQAQQDPPGFVVQPGKGMLPEETAKQMQMPAGFTAKVFAGEPDVFQPIAFAIDDRGRL